MGKRCTVLSPELAESSETRSYDESPGGDGTSRPLCFVTLLRGCRKPGLLRSLCRVPGHLEGPSLPASAIIFWLSLRERGSGSGLLASRCPTHASLNPSHLCSPGAHSVLTLHLPHPTMLGATLVQMR